MPSYKLTYFNGRGRAELARLIFTAAEAEFTDNRIEGAAWPALKPNTPFKQLPLLEVDGKQIGQSGAIVRYLAKKFDLAGKTVEDQARADSIREAIADLFQDVVKGVFEKDEAKKAEIMKQVKEEKVPNTFKILENLLTENAGGDGYFVGDALTYADLAFVDFTFPLPQFGITLDDFPKLKALNDRVNNIPKIAKYIKERPETQF